MISKYLAFPFAITLLFSLTVVFSNIAYADPTPTTTPIPTPTPTKVSSVVNSQVAPFTDIGRLLGNVFSVVLILASILLFLYLLLGGIQWLTSGGDKMATQAARDRITAALTGLLIILAVWGIFTILEAAFGIKVLSGIRLPVEVTNRYAVTP